MQRILLFSISLVLVIAGCKKTVLNPTTIVSTDTTIVQGDRQMRFALPSASSYDTVYWLTDQQVNIQKFNIDYYAGADSIFYSFYSANDAGSYGTVELFNFTDSIPITGSLINVATNETIVYFQSGNLKTAFPHKEITLGLRIKASRPAAFFNAGYGILYVYRK
jgi:hypothetical protein